MNEPNIKVNYSVSPAPTFMVALVAQVKETDALIEKFCRTNKNAVYLEDLDGPC